MTPNYKGEILNVDGLEKGFVAYNPFPLEGDEKIVAVRVESFDSDYLNLIEKKQGPYNPRIQFFRLHENSLELIKEAPVFEGLEDPFGTWITVNNQKKLLFGGVSFRVDKFPIIKTHLFLASDFISLDPNSPLVEIDGMRDLRFCQLESSDLIMLTRPTTGEAYPGRIGIVKLPVKDLTEGEAFKEKLKLAKLLRFSIDELNVKLGGNALYSKHSNLLHLICHAATADPYLNKKEQIVENDFDYGVLHYKGYEAFIDLDNLDGTFDLRLIVDSRDFSPRPEEIKGPRFADVVFPGGIMNGYLYCGVGDRSIGRIKI